MALSTIITTAALTLGVVAVSRRLREKLNLTQSPDATGAKRAAKKKTVILDFEKDPETGSFTVPKR
ncbi:MAG: hypothetical protein ACWA5L_03835 [bacterium]